MTPPDDDATSRRLAAMAARPVAPTGWTPGTRPMDGTPEPLPRTVGAMREAGRAYAAAYGHPTGHAAPARRRVRWQVPWRLVASAGVALLVLAGGVALRAAAGAAGPAVQLPVPQAAAVATTGPAPSASATPVSSVLVHVVGAVTSAGVVRLPAGSRVVDAVAAAGGAAPDADLAGVNLARPVVDGEQIVVPRPGEALPSGAPGAPASVGPATLVDLNTADVAALDALPGIGPVLAQRIVDHRATSPFGTIDELGDVSGIGPTLLEKLRPLVRV